MESQPVAGADAPSTCTECGAEITSTSRNAVGNATFAQPCGHMVAGAPAAPTHAPLIRYGVTYAKLADLALASERRCPRGARPTLVMGIQGHHLTRKVQVCPGLRGKNLGHRGAAGTPEAHTLVRLHVDETKRWLRKNARHLLDPAAMNKLLRDVELVQRRIARAARGAAPRVAP